MDGEERSYLQEHTTINSEMHIPFQGGLFLGYPKVKAHYCPSNENMDRIIPVITPHCVFSLLFFISSFVP
jgi:hypothetical protein